MNTDKNMTDEEAKRFIRKRTIVSFSVFFIGIVLAVLAWNWLRSGKDDNGISSHLRTVLNADEKVNNAIFSEKHLEKEYPVSKADKDVRVNGDVGMGDNFDPSKWNLTIIRHPDCKLPDSVMHLGINDVRAFPKKSMTFQFKCIEGWSQISWWGGTKLSDFLKKYRLGTHSGRAPDSLHPEDMYKYIGFMTPDSAYYVGIDMKSAIHPQTLLCYEMNGDTLPMEQGFPLRLIIPIKYGVKNIKRIAYMYFSDTRPPDYWYERGYEYDAAL